MTFIGGVVAVTLLLIGVLHAIWIFTPWPLRSRADMARIVVGVEEDQLPSTPLIAAVAGLIVIAAYLTSARASLLGEIGPSWLYVVGTLGVAAVLLARGFGGLASSLRKSTDFAHWDRRLYAPLCIVLGGLCATVGIFA